MNQVYLQTYSLGSAMRDDFKGSLKKVADIGYSGVEFAGGYGNMPAAELKAYLEELGLEPISSHVGLEKIETDIPYLAELGASYVICPSTSLNSYEEILDKAKEMNRLGELAKKAGLKFGYHNHTQEFAQFEGKYALDILMENTDPELVMFQLDVGWATCAGINVAAYIQEHSGRIQLIHVKETDRVTGVQEPWDFSKFEKDEKGHPIFPQSFLDEMAAIQKTNCPTGEGIIDWQQIKTVADANGAKAYIVEREYDYKGQDIFGCITEDLAHLKTIQ